MAEMTSYPAGTVCSVDLATNAPEAAKTFHGENFGGTARTGRSLMDGLDTLFQLDGKEVGGMIELDAEWGSLPPSWSIYFGVEDCDRALATARRLGGSIVMDSKEVENVGRFAFLGDPQGAIFAVSSAGTLDACRPSLERCRSRLTLCR